MDREMENRVGFGPRLGAYMLDIIVLSTLALALHKPAAALLPQAVAAFMAEAARRPDAEQIRPMLEWSARLGVTYALLSPVYALFEAFLGFTPGKFALGLRVATDTGHKASWRHLFIRYGIKASAAVFGLLGLLTGVQALGVLGQAMGWATLVGCLLVLSPARLALHDRIAGTSVLRKGDVVQPMHTGGASSLGAGP